LFVAQPFHSRSADAADDRHRYGYNKNKIPSDAAAENFEQCHARKHEANLEQKSQDSTLSLHIAITSASTAGSMREQNGPRKWRFDKHYTDAA